MNSALFQLLILAGIAIFLLIRLRSVLGTREGFERPVERSHPDVGPKLDVVEDADITEFVDWESPSADALRKMKATDHSFSVSRFVVGARGAYEMILMAYENGDLSQVQDFLGPEVYEAFAQSLEARREQGLTIEAEFKGLRDSEIALAEFDETTNTANIDMRFIAEMTWVVRDKGGDIIEGSASEIKRQKDYWSFEHVMGAETPIWKLVATGE